MVFQLGFRGLHHDIRIHLGSALVVCDSYDLYLHSLFSLKGWGVPKLFLVKKSSFHVL